MVYLRLDPASLSYMTRFYESVSVTLFRSFPVDAMRMVVERYVNGARSYVNFLGDALGYTLASFVRQLPGRFHASSGFAYVASDRLLLRSLGKLTDLAECYDMFDFPADFDAIRSNLTVWAGSDDIHG